MAKLQTDVFRVHQDPQPGKALSGFPLPAAGLWAGSSAGCASWPAPGAGRVPRVAVAPGRSPGRAPAVPQPRQEGALVWGLHHPWAPWGQKTKVVSIFTGKPLALDLNIYRSY